jgi:hypothetical protein
MRSGRPYLTYDPVGDHPHHVTDTRSDPVPMVALARRGA